VLKNLRHFGEHLASDVFDLGKEGIAPSHIFVAKALYEFTGAHYKFFFIVTMLLDAVIA
jgi:hypothetical protein